MLIQKLYSLQGGFKLICESDRGKREEYMLNIWSPAIYVRIPFLGLRAPQAFGCLEVAPIMLSVVYNIPI